MTRILRDERGATLALAALSFVPLVAAAGFALDLGTAWLARERLAASAQAAADAAVLHLRTDPASAASAACSDPARRAAAERVAAYVASANFPDGAFLTAGGPTTTLSCLGDDAVRVEVSADSLTSFTSLLSSDRSRIAVAAAGRAADDGGATPSYREGP